MERFNVSIRFDNSKELKFYARITDNATGMAFENSCTEIETIANWVAQVIVLLEKGRKSKNC